MSFSRIVILAVGSLLCGLQAGCSTPTPNWHFGISVSTDPGLEHLAPQVGRACLHYSHYVAQELRVERIASINVRVVNDAGAGLHGYSDDTRIVVQGDENAPLILAHELVHWHMRGSLLQQRLPAAVQEGICEFIAARGLGLEASLAQIYAPLLPQTVEDAQSILRYSNSQIHDRSLSDTVRVYAYGWFLARTLGLEQLWNVAESSNGPEEAATVLLERAAPPFDVNEIIKALLHL